MSGKALAFREALFNIVGGYASGWAAKPPSRLKAGLKTTL